MYRVFPRGSHFNKRICGMSLFTHLSMLEEKHNKLEKIISEESVRPLPDFPLMQTLKKQKLLLKEELLRLRGHGQHHHDAA
jgi:hypothetical protein